MFECTICTEEFNNTSEVVSTTCGHVFHQRCLRDWTVRSGNCPQCRSANPGNHKIFLNFDEATKSLRETLKLKASLEEKARQSLSLDESHVVEVSRLESQLQQNERLCIQLNEKIEFLRAQQVSLEQENTVKTVENNELKLKVLGLERQLARQTTENAQLRGLIDNFTNKGPECSVNIKQNFGDKKGDEQQASKRELLLAQNECTTLKDKLKCELQEKIMLAELNNTLEEKLKQIQLQLQKEIRHSTELSVDKMRLQSMMKRTTACGDSALNRDSRHEEAGNKDRKQKVDKHEFATPISDRPINNGVIIKGLKGNFLHRETVLKLAQQMQLSVGEDDIEHTIVRQRPNNISLIVGLKTKALRDLFLTHADKLKNNEETQHYEICAYSATTDLLTYAMKLKSIGYKSVYIYKDQVYCRVDNKSMPIKIFNRETVDKMMEQNPTPSRAMILSPGTHSHPSANAVTNGNSESPACSRVHRPGPKIDIIHPTTGRSLFRENELRESNNKPIIPICNRGTIGQIIQQNPTPMIRVPRRVFKINIPNPRRNLFECDDEFYDANQY